MNIERKHNRQNYYDYKTILDEMGLDNPTAKEIFEFLLGDADLNNPSDYVVYKYNDIPKTTIWNRINLLWVYPLFFITIPIQYLITGDFGFNRNTKIGKIINWLVVL